VSLDPEALLAEAAGADTPAFALLVGHGWAVARAAVGLARRLAVGSVDLAFVEQAAVLHDVGAAFTDVPELGLTGGEAYIRHGLLGREFLDARGYPHHGLVCERHVGVGLTRDEIRARGLPLPDRDMRPVSLEEILICYADKFFSKNAARLDAVNPLAKVRRRLGSRGHDKLVVFDEWVARFGLLS